MTRHFAWSSVVVGTGVDPVTFRFSGSPQQTLSSPGVFPDQP
jgi:hypothetical protein